MKVIKQKTQQKWAIRSLILFGALLSGVIAFLFNPIKGANARNTWIYKIMDGDIPTLTVCDPNDTNKCLTIMDRNLGATKAGTGCSSADSGACGYHFQWGNNNGFELGCWNSIAGADTVTNEVTEVLAIWSSDYNNIGYFGTNFIKENYRTKDYWNDNNSINHNGLWGGANDNQSNNWGLDLNNPIDRRGPCPEGYHVPSQGERGALLKYWTANYTGIGNDLTLNGTEPLNYFYDTVASEQFRNDFKIPFAGFRDGFDGKIWGVNSYIYYWSSSPISGRSYYFRIEKGSFKLNSTGDRADGRSIRCFKDVPFGYPTTFQVIIWDKGRTNQIFSGEILGGEKISESGTLMAMLSEYSAPKYGYIFSGWYDSDLNIIWDLDNPVITQLDLQAIFVPMGHIITFNTNGGTPVDDIIGYHDALIIEPNKPIKSGYAFMGRYIDEQLIEKFDFENTIITGDIVLYAKWEACQEGYKSINNKCVANSAGIYYESGVIKMTNGNGKTIHIKDKNQGAEDSGYTLHQLAILNNEYAACYGSPGIDPIEGLERGVKNNPDVNQENCRREEEILGDMGNLLGIENPTIDEVLEYCFEYSQSVYGTFYFWGNNNGATYEELSGGIVNELLYLRGFDNGKIGEDNTGWGEGEDDNPCDSSNGEYLPTMSDWKNALDIRGEINGMGDEYEERRFISGEFFNDILVLGGYFSSGDGFDGGGVKSRLAIHNQENNKNHKLLVLLFSNPVYAYEDKNIYFYRNPYLWGTDGNITDGNIRSSGLGNFSGSDIDNLNGTAAPVRCFLRAYTVGFDTDGGSEIEDIEVVGNQPIQAPNSPTKLNYTFKGWYLDTGFTQEYDFSEPVTSEMVLYAKWEKIKTSGGTQLKRDNCPGGDYSNSYYDGDCGSEPEKDDNQHHSAEVVYDTLVFNPQYSDEMNQAYQYAYHYGITTKAPISNANIDGNLTRIAMAKMLSQYAINVLGIKPDTSRNNKFGDVSDKLDGDYDDGVTLAYQLGIMGINMPNNEFRPNDLVPRAEFVTALSRLLYKTSDGIFEETPQYYVPHMEKLVYEGIINNPDPKMLELRGYVMLMLMRSDK